MSLHKQYRRDKLTTWIKPMEGVEVEAAYFDYRHPEYVNAITKITKPVRKLVEQGMLSPEEDRKYAIQAFVEVCVKGWRTVTSKVDGQDTLYRSEIELEDGVWLPFSRENAVKVFTVYQQFYLDCVDLARELSNYQVTAEAIKN